MSECDTTAGTRFYADFFFSSSAARVLLLPVLCSFLKTSQEGSEHLQLERKRHLLHPPPEAGGMEQEPAPSTVEIYPNRVCCLPAAPCSAQMLQPQAHLCKDIFSYHGATAVPLPQPALFKKAGLTATATGDVNLALVPQKYLFRCLIPAVVRLPSPLRNYIFSQGHSIKKCYIAMKIR